jgi:methyl-accepting chemotaxis protein
MISQTNQNAKLSYDSSERILEKTAEGLQTMKQMSHSMDTIQKSNIQLQEISKMINDINSKTSVINDIVFKTQLLSFNASIEAARAGQHGRGFAVVAEEVGNLAEMSGHASREIESLIGDSQRKVKETLEVIQNRVKDGNQVSQLAYQNFEEISHQVKEINLQIKYISEATQQQSLGIEQTNIAIKQMDSASEANNQSSRNAFRTSEELKMQGDTLTQVVGHLTAMVGRKFNPQSAEKKISFAGGALTAEKPQSPSEDLQLLMDGLVNKNSKPSEQSKTLTRDDKKFKRVA